MKKLDRIIGAGGGGGKGGGGSSHVPTESPDSLQSTQYARVLDLLSEGEIGGLVNGLKSVFLDGTPIQNADGTNNFSGFEFFTRNGTQDQEPIEGFTQIESVTAVGVEVKAATSVTRTLADANLDAALVTVMIPQLSYQNPENGDLGGTSVEIALDVQTNGGGFVAQAMRSEFSAAGFAVTTAGGAMQEADTTAKVTVSWAGIASTNNQTCTLALQYRAYGSASAWTTLESFTFSGRGYRASRTGGGIFGNETVWYTAAPTASHDFTPTFSSGRYEFQVVKTSGTGTVKITAGASLKKYYTDIISGKTMSRYQRSYRLALPGSGPWDIRVRRITADSTAANLANKTFFDTITSIVDRRLRYPNSALAALKIDAKNFARIPVRGFEIYGLKVLYPSNYDPLARTYTGAWNGTFTRGWTDNPAWVFYDLVTNSRYGVGEFIPAALVDKWGLYEIAQYCDEMVSDGFGGTEPRFTCNLYLQSREEAYTVINNLASIFRAMTYWGAGALTCAQDAPADPVQRFTAANVINGAFAYSGSSAKGRHTVALVSWNDPDDLYKQRVEYVEDVEGIARYGIVETQIAAMGCTSRGQAHRLGKWMLATERLLTETITFKTGLEGAYVYPGAIIETSDPIRAGKRFGGRVVSATTSAVTLDAAVSIESGKTYTLGCQLADGTLEMKTVTNAVGSASVISVSSNFSSAPQAQSIWVLAANDLAPETWRVVAVKESGKAEIEVTALKHLPGLYALVESNIALEPTQTSALSMAVTTPQNLNFTESLFQFLNSVSVKGTLFWDAASDAAQWEGSYRKIGENAINFSTTTNSVELLPLTSGEYEFTLYALNALGRRSGTATLRKTIVGKAAPPSDVSAFSLIKSSGIALASWATHPDLDVVVGGNIVIRYTPLLTGATWNDGIILDVFPGSATTAALPLMTGTYMAKALDSSGNWSTGIDAFVATEGMVTGFTTVASITESPSFSGAKTGTYVVSSALQLSSAATVGSMTGNVSTWGYISLLGGIRSAGTYDFSAALDCGTVATRRFQSSISGAQFEAGDLISQRPLVSAWNSVTGVIINDCDATLYISTTNDNPAGSPTWGEYAPFFVGDFTCRAARFRLELESGSPTHNMRITTLSVAAKTPI